MDFANLLATAFRPETDNDRRVTLTEVKWTDQIELKSKQPLEGPFEFPISNFESKSDQVERFQVEPFQAGASQVRPFQVRPSSLETLSLSSHPRAPLVGLRMETSSFRKQMKTTFQLLLPLF